MQGGKQSSWPGNTVLLLSVCQRVITLGMLLIKESELSSGARTCRKPPAPPGSVFSKPQFCLPPKMKEDRTFFILSSACQS